VAEAAPRVRKLPLLVAISGCVLLAQFAARRLGFSHVSDDDYARVVIAQGFALHPKLDPSGTSWLPLPFYWTGAAMMMLGRTLRAAQLVSALTALGVGPLLVFAGLRAGLTRNASVAGAMAFVLAPWSVWLGLSTVPELPTAALASAGFLLSVAPARRDKALGALLLVAATLSRYEAWPLGAVAAALGVAIGIRDRDRAALGFAAVGLLGPVLWVLWNAHAHGDGLHFMARVSRFRQHAGLSGSLLSNLLFYPKAWLTDAPESALLLPVLALGAADTRLRKMLAGVLCTLGFLVLGCIQNGAPTHHPVRALVCAMPLVTLGAAATVDAWGQRARVPSWSRTLWAWTPVGAALVMCGLRLPAPPGASADEDRSFAIELGRTLRDQVPLDKRLLVVPCRYEHFAFIAAFGRPEDVDIGAQNAAGGARGDCPRVRPSM
jgi:hypothetical protein